MLFKPYLVEAILQSEKTQTRRLRKPTHSVVLHDNRIIAIYSKITRQSNRLLWRVGNTYAIQPGRGKNAVGRFHLLSIRQEPLQYITPTDVTAEGLAAYPDPTRGFAGLWNDIHTTIGTRWQDNPEVFVLTFELVTPK